jgi:iron complex transport system substrate-binding protein
MMKKINENFPRRIICLTEEGVETLYCLKQDHRLVGVSSFVKRPAEARKLPKVSLFTSSNYKKIAQLNPDLILGHSDIQKEIAKDLIEQGFNVFIANHRSLTGILDYIAMLGNLTESQREAKVLLKMCHDHIQKAKKFAKTLISRPKVYIEEWDNPPISGIEWFAEIVNLCGGEVLFKNQSKGILALERIVTFDQVKELNPDMILACWCGKKVKINAIISRDGWNEITAVKEKMVYELAPEVFLQPGPAPIISGIDILINLFSKWNITQQSKN